MADICHTVAMMRVTRSRNFMAILLIGGISCVAWEKMFMVCVSAFKLRLNDLGLSLAYDKMILILNYNSIIIISISPISQLI